MFSVRRAEDRGHADHGWLNTYHTFSFADYYDPAHMGFRNLRVINEDRVQPGKGFGMHPHRDMEIITYVLDGALKHRDSMGNGSSIAPGEVQRMSAGSGVTHSEYNASTDNLVHFLQIWLIPTEKNIPPSYEQKAFSSREKDGRFRLIASPNGQDGSVAIHADALLYAGTFDVGKSAGLSLPLDRHAWVHVARGKVKINDFELNAGDGVALANVSTVRVEGAEPSEVLVFDLP
jgi:redox-sensitive bicupin YhaK (pirin superfamily)